MIGPFDSLRDYIAALDSKGLLVRIPKMDQDKYEATGFAYQLVKEFGYDLAPAFLIEKIYLCGITATPPNRKITKTAIGSTETVGLISIA